MENQLENLKHAGLFCGIGGFHLAADWMGWDNVFHCEINPFGNRVLQYYWPKTISHEDVTKTDFTRYRGTIDVLSAGFPCQPFSAAGKRKGTDDDRFLWPETIRVVRESRPRWLVFENVPGLFTILQPDSVSEVEIKEIQLFCEDEQYQVNEIIERVQRRIIATIISEIRAEGYSFAENSDGTPILLCVPACATGAPHRRDRVWFVAHHVNSADGSLRAGDGTRPPGQAHVHQAPEKRSRPDLLDNGCDGLSPDADQDTERNGRRSGQAQEPVLRQQRHPEPGDRERVHPAPVDTHDNGSGGIYRNDEKQPAKSGQPAQSEPDGRGWYDTYPAGAGLEGTWRRALSEPAQYPAGDATDTHHWRQKEQKFEAAGDQQRDRDDTHPDHQGLEGRPQTGDAGSGRPQPKQHFGGYDEKREHWYEAAARLCILDDGFSGRLDNTPLSKGGKSFSKAAWRTESLKAAGNAVHPGVVYEIFRAIAETERLIKSIA